MSDWHIYIFEVDVEPEDEEDQTEPATYDIHLVHGDQETDAEGMAAQVARETYDEDYDTKGEVTDLRYVGGVHPVTEPTVISVHTQR